MPIGPRGGRFRSIAGSWGRGGILAAASLVQNGITYTAPAGSAGNSTTVTTAAGGPLNRALSVGVAGSAITVTPATNGAGAISSTQAQVAAAVNANGPAAALVTASGGTGALVVAAGPTSLAGGSDYVIGRQR